MSAHKITDREPAQPTPEAVPMWRYTAHDSEIFLEYKRPDGPWVQAGIFFPSPGFGIEDFMRMVGQVRHAPPPVGEVTDSAMDWMIDNGHELLIWRKDGPSDDQVMRGFIVAGFGIQFARSNPIEAILAAMRSGREGEKS